MKSLNDRIKEIQDNIKDIKFTEITKTDKFTLIKAQLDCPVYIAFYANFIVCSGDYGEWVFDCTWDTTKGNIPSSIGYLLEKLSINCNKIYFDKAVIKENFEEAKENFYELYISENTYSSRILGELDEIFSDFSSACQMSDKYRITSVVDEYADKIYDLLGMGDFEDWESFYSIGDTIHPHLVMNLAILDKLREVGIAQI